MNHHDHVTLEFPRDLVGLPPAVSSELVDLADGDRFGPRPGRITGPCRLAQRAHSWNL